MKLELMFTPYCYYCKLVMEVIEENNLDIEFFDLTQRSDQMERMIKDTGRQTVPCLYIDNKPMHESAEIIKWLEKNLDKIDKKP